MSGLYIHIPFCARRCIYCGFYSTTFRHLRAQYVEAICREMRMRFCSGVDTVYIGGGTPSQLSPNMLEKIFNTAYEVYGIDYSSAEVTIECNPDDIDEDYATALSTLPVNRVSLGVQSFSDTLLHFLRRRHDASQACHAVGILQDAGFSNISIDLMFGFPGQTLEALRSDVDKALSLDVQHISAYSLMYEENTPLRNMLDKGEISEMDDDIYIIMYNTMADMLSAGGYEHYEISNFARPGFRSRHNSSYWHDIPYIGVGAAAHSYTGSSRQSNVSDIEEYISSINKGIIPCECEILSEKDHYNDMIATALRTKEGVKLDEVVERYGKEYSDYMMSNAHPHISTGLLSLNEGQLHLTRTGIALSDTVMSDLIMI